MPSIFGIKSKSEKLSSYFNDQAILLSQEDITNIINKDAATFHKVGDIFFKRKKYLRALEWYQKASAQNYAKSQNEIGWMYRNGLGVRRDYTEALDYYRKAADNGSSTAQANIGYMYCNGLEVTKNYQTAMFWYYKAANMGNEHAEDNIGYLYEHGFGVRQDYNTAKDWYLKAALHGSISAQNNIGRCYQNGLGVTKDVNEAIMWLLKADNLGHTSAAYNLGWIYEFENEVRDQQTAIYWYRKCINQGHKDAKKRLEIVLTTDFSIKVQPKRDEPMEYRWEIEEMSLEPSPPEGESSAAADLPKETFSILRQEAQIKQKTKSNTNKMKSLEEKIAQLMTTNDSLIDDAQNDLYYDDSSEDEHTPVKDQYSAMEN